MAATGIPHWDDDPEVWDTLVLGTNTMPGVWDIEDGNIKRVLDVKKAPGLDGARIKDMGYENGAMTCVGQLVGADDWATLQQIAATLKLTQKGKARTPIAISHPKALYLGVTQVYVTEIECPRLDNGIMTATIRVLEYVPTPKKAGKAKPASTVSLAAEFVDADFNSVTAAQQLKQREAAAEAESANSAAAWPKFKAVPPQYAPVAN